ncbi:glutamate-rich protein 1 isoform X2 [Microcaecilia unicolor]|uniref:Glutamate-rich protein 1 isoform X2 n=1 Tax=Microcaecilia unicolor TaxID=1415580 RepID=A0A6P7XM81_9AMPH|nr:glutamate-rich protein 1 isoform X2 [Microcaecilia unicolor]
MATTGRREVFIEKVLKKLYCSPTSASHLQGLPMQLETSSTPEAELRDSINTLSAKCTSSTVDEKEIPNRKLYTVSLPPDGCLPTCPGTSNLTHSELAESISSSDEEDYSVHSSRKGARKKKKRKTWKDSGVQVASKRQTHLLQDDTDSPKMSKNKKRKMKKKRQKEKMKAAGLLTKVSGVDFTYQPEKCVNEEADIEDVDKKMSEILEFLKATQEIYFADGKSTCDDLDICSGTVCEFFKHLETHRSPFSDVTLLYKLKSLVLLQDIERLKAALEHFKEHSTMLPEYASVVCSLFNYWITDILPLRK